MAALRISDVRVRGVPHEWHKAADIYALAPRRRLEEVPEFKAAMPGSDQARLTTSIDAKAGRHQPANQARTSTTELSVPCWFQTFSRASGSGIHCPSSTNLY